MKIPAMKLSSIKLISIVVEANLGANIRDVAWEISRLAKELDCLVGTTFNETDLVCYPGESHNVVMTRYRQFLGKGKKV